VTSQQALLGSALVGRAAYENLLYQSWVVTMLQELSMAEMQQTIDQALHSVPVLAPAPEEQGPPAQDQAQQQQQQQQQQQEAPAQGQEQPPAQEQQPQAPASGTEVAPDSLQTPTEQPSE